jgi:Copper transport outer membrane protein, MctB
MIDFRYLVVTIISIFLALTVGIMLGAGFVGDPLARDLRNRIDTVNSEVREQREQINQLEGQNEAMATWAQAVEPWVINGRLAGRDVVLFTIEGTDGGVTEGSLAALEDAGANVATQIDLEPKLALESQPEADQLATIVESVAQRRREVLLDAATALGEGAASLSRQGEDTTETGGGTTEIAYSELLRLLEDEDFISVARNSEEGELVPPGSTFVIAGGNATTPPFDVVPFVGRLSSELVGAETGVVTTESSSSQWELTTSIREDDDLNEQVSTVDTGESSLGHVALVLVLDQPSSQPAGHYGADDGTLPLPELPDN